MSSRRRGLLGRIRHVFASVRASLENPKYSLNDPQAWEFLGGDRSSTGLRISPEKALSDSRWWRGHTLRASMIAKTATQVVRITEAGGKEPDRKHPAYRLLRRRPNAEMTAFTWKQVGMGHLMSKGNWFNYIDRAGNGKPKETILLNPDRCYPVRENGRLWYVVQAPSGDKWLTRKIAPEDILHFKGYGFDGLVGYSVLRMALDQLGGAIAKREHGYRFFRNGTSSRLLLEHPEHMDDDAYKRFKESWDQANAGVDNSFKTAILEDGMKAHVISFSAKESQLAELILGDTIDIANFTGVPAGKLGHPGRTSYASVEQENLAFLTDTIDADFANIESECFEKLLSEEEKAAESHEIEFDRDSLVRADVKSENEALKVAVGGVPWMTPDEVRAKKRLPSKGGKAGELAMPLNTSSGAPPADAPAPPPKGPDSPPDDSPPSGIALERAKAAAVKALAQARARMRTRLAHAGRRASKAPEKFGEWIDGLVREHEPVIRDAVEPASAVVCALAGGDAELRAAEEAGAVLARFRAVCEEIYDSPRSEFAARMGAAMDRFEKE